MKQYLKELLIGVVTGFVLFFGPWLWTASYGFWRYDGAALWLPYFLASIACYLLITAARYFFMRLRMTARTLLASFLIFLLGVSGVGIIYALIPVAAFW